MKIQILAATVAMAAISAAPAAFAIDAHVGTSKSVTTSTHVAGTGVDAGVNADTDAKVNYDHQKSTTTKHMDADGNVITHSDTRAVHHDRDTDMDGDVKANTTVKSTTSTMAE